MQPEQNNTDSEGVINNIDMTHNFGIEPEEAKEIRENLNPDNPPGLEYNSDYAKLLIWLETLAQKNGYPIFQVKITADEEKDTSLWMLSLSVPDEKGTVEYFNLIQEYKEKELQDINLTKEEISLVKSIVKIGFSSSKEDKEYTSGGEVILRDGKLIIPMDTLHNLELDKETSTGEKSITSDDFTALYDELIQQLATEGIPFSQMNIYSQLGISYSIEDEDGDGDWETNKGIKISLYKSFSLRYESDKLLTEGNPIGIEMRIDIPVDEPELLNLEQLKLGMSSKRVKEIIEGYIPLPKQ